MLQQLIETSLKVEILSYVTLHLVAENNVRLVVSSIKFV